MRNKNIYSMAVIIISAVLGTVFVAAGEHKSINLGGTITFSGVPMSEFTKVKPNIQYRLRKPKEKWEEAKLSSYDNAAARYKIEELPCEPIELCVEYHITGDKPTFPGNYRGYIAIDANQLNAKEAMDQHLPVEIIIHLLKPADNNVIDDKMERTDVKQVHPTEVTFEWEPIFGVAEYGFYISRYRDSSHSDGYGKAEDIKIQRVFKPSYTVRLADSEPNEHYAVRITVLNGGFERIGRYMRTHSDSFGSDYRFKVVSKPQP